MVWIIQIKNGCCILGHEILKSAVSQKLIDDLY